MCVKKPNLFQNVNENELKELHTQEFFGATAGFTTAIFNSQPLDAECDFFHMLNSLPIYIFTPPCLK